MLETRELLGGLTLITEEAPWQRGVSLGLFVRAGVVDEPPGQEGIAHLLEHMVFRGTASYRGDELSAAIEEDGGELNAYTTKEYTCLWGRTLPQGLPRYLELLAELFLRPKLQGRDLRREVQVIAEEHALWFDNPEELSCDLLEEEVFQGRPLGRRVLGDPEAIEALTAAEVRDFHQRHWRVERAVLAIAGPIDAGRVAKAAEVIFRQEEAAAPRLPARPRRPAAQATNPGALPQVHLAIGGEARRYGDPSLAAQELVVQELGGGPNSRLFLRLREEEALSYGVYAYNTAYAGGGVWGAYADLPADGLQAGLRAIAEEAEGIVRGRWRAADLERMRRSAIGALLLGLDGPFARVERHALQLLLEGRTQPVEADVARIEAVDTRAVRSAAQELFDPERWRIVALLPDGSVLRGSYRDFTQGGAVAWRSR